MEWGLERDEVAEWLCERSGVQGRLAEKSELGVKKVELGEWSGHAEWTCVLQEAGNLLLHLL